MNNAIQNLENFYSRLYEAKNFNFNKFFENKIELIKEDVIDVLNGHFVSMTFSDEPGAILRLDKTGNIPAEKLLYVEAMKEIGENMGVLIETKQTKNTISFEAVSLSEIQHIPKPMKGTMSQEKRDKFIQERTEKQQALRAKIDRFQKTGEYVLVQ